MTIENNPKEIAAMEEFHKGNRAEGLRLQEEFASAFREEYKDKDHCPCKKACRYHGNCKECVAIHRAHQEHVPNCMRPLLNKKIKLLSELTEHTIAGRDRDAEGDSEEGISVNCRAFRINLRKESICGYDFTGSGTGACKSY